MVPMLMITTCPAVGTEPEVGAVSVRTFEEVAKPQTLAPAEEDEATTCCVAVVVELPTRISMDEVPI